MGQRLNIEIFAENRILANAYYHWSGYTRSAYRLCCNIIAEYKGAEPTVEEAVRLLETTGAGFDEYEIENAITVLPAELCKEATDRNRGLIAITKSAIEETRGAEEARVTIYLDAERVDFDVWNQFEEEDLEDYGLVLGHTDLPIHWLRFEDMGALDDLIDYATNGTQSIAVKTKRGEIICPIE